MGMAGNNIPLSQVVAQMAQRAGQQNQQAQQAAQGSPTMQLASMAQAGQQNQQAQQAAQVAQAFKGGMGGKGGQPPSPQQLGQGLQQQALMQRQMPMSNQRQPQGGMAGPTARKGRFGRLTTKTNAGLPK